MMIIDFETRSRCDLKTTGADKYAASPTTEVLCMGWMMQGDYHAAVWVPAHGGPPDLLRDALEDGTCLIAAHNARFDQLIYEYLMVNDYGFPPIKQERWYCTSAQARLNGLPANLDDATRAIDAHHKKSHRGSYLIKQLCIPAKETGQFNSAPALMDELYRYCAQDVMATSSLIKNTRRMSDVEHRDWLANERINDRGVRIDTELAELCMSYAAAERDAINAELTGLTAGAVTRYTQGKRIKDWALATQGAELADMMSVVRDGVPKISLDKGVRAKVLDAADAGELNLDDRVYNVFAALDDGNKSSVSKYKTMLARAEDDGRVRGSFVYAGCQTVRFSSRGLQLHNMRRDAMLASDAVLTKAMMSQGHQLSDVMTQLARLLRPTLIPQDGHVYVAGDWSSIESRALAYIADDPVADVKLKEFKQGKDMYLRAADDIGKPGERQLGKVIELSMGYGGGVGAFKAMARNYNINLPDDEINDHKNAWRVSNSWAPELWARLEKQAKWAINHPDKKAKVSRGIVYYFTPDLMGGTLICELPDGTLLSYPQARVEDQQITAMKAAYGMPADATEWPRYSLWGGLLAENVTQAFCAALLRSALFKVDAVMHVHDEIILEVPTAEGQQCADMLQKIMETPPKWAEGLPLVAEPEILTRYGKG